MGTIAKETVELKHSILMYLTISGTPTPDLGSISMKLIDCIDDALLGRDPTNELDKLAEIVARTAAVAVLNRVDSLKDHYPNLIAVHRNLDGIIHNCVGEPIVNKNHYLRAMAIALRELKILTNFNYPSITDSEGNEL